MIFLISCFFLLAITNAKVVLECNVEKFTSIGDAGLSATADSIFIDEENTNGQDVLKIGARNLRVVKGDESEIGNFVAHAHQLACDDDEGGEEFQVIKGGAKDETNELHISQFSQNNEADQLDEFLSSNVLGTVQGRDDIQSIVIHEVLDDGTEPKRVCCDLREPAGQVGLGLFGEFELEEMVLTCDEQGQPLQIFDTDFEGAVGVGVFEREVDGRPQTFLVVDGFNVIDDGEPKTGSFDVRISDAVCGENDGGDVVALAGRDVELTGIDLRLVNTNRGQISLGGKASNEGDFPGAITAAVNNVDARSAVFLLDDKKILCCDLVTLEEALESFDIDFFTEESVSDSTSTESGVTNEGESAPSGEGSASGVSLAAAVVVAAALTFVF